ncbi:hypothetical protein [Algoriphagus pacificus]|uniref:Uncharacterized protein n=1 Tax=Algoriphagus pacificus TaxID=2811234 RepID=A0ABS3CJ39_9BACT|nr:hypothetical protein [Algoriphagus pacificus]MBN7816250.1 hypothetical protein [Algoriphagus pacificus]
MRDTNFKSTGIIERSDRLELHYFFKDESHSIDSILRNECEKEILFIFKEISDTLKLDLRLETSPPEDGGFKEIWNFIGKNSAQISLLVSVAAIIISRFPTENRELTKLQIENLKLDNELKSKELEKLNLKALKEEDELIQDKLIGSVELVNKNYRIAWRKSNFYKKLFGYNKLDSIEILRFKANEPVGKKREVLRNDFKNYILDSDDLPPLSVEKAVIDVISPAIKRGRFKWKGFYNNEIISFDMNDSIFRQQVLKGDVHFSNKFSIEVEMTQERKINQDGGIKITNTSITKVWASVENGNRIEYK